MTIIFRRPTPLEFVTVVAVAVVAYLAFLAPDADRHAGDPPATTPPEQTAAASEAQIHPSAFSGSLKR
jgi:hypothetical protein